MSESAEQRTRRRWISLAEFIAVAGLLIGIATLYLNWSGQREDHVAKETEAETEQKAKAIVTLTGTVTGGGDAIAVSDPARTFSAAVARFPTVLAVPTRDAMPGPTLRAAWFEKPLLALTDSGADERTGRLPVLLTVTWWDGDSRHRDTALYDVLWKTEPRILRGRKLVLTGLALHDRTASAAKLDAAWAREQPKP